MESARDVLRRLGVAGRVHAQQAGGQVLACVSRPLTGVTLDLAAPTASDGLRREG
ncbi:hypothetical protein ACIPMT_26685 [Streptomyces griseus]|uniref:hypothetical protein n=1 Tax=Streptomyces griseus TaxID=1911 RepID=UPI0038061462